MPTDAVLLKLMILSAIIGFSVFCGSYALLVWKKRRKSTTTSSSSLRKWSVSLCLLGLLGMGLSLIVRETVRAEGMLKGDGLFAIQPIPNMTVEQMVDEGTIVKEGDLLARFSSPEGLSELKEAELNRELLEKQKETLKLQPLPLNPELVRRHEHASAEQRQLLSNWTNIFSSRQAAERESNTSLILQKDNLAKIDSEIKSTRGEVNQANVKREIALKQLKREQNLANRQNLATNELNDREKEVRSLEEEVKKQEARIQSLESHRTQTLLAIQKLEKFSEDQIALFSKELFETRKEINRVKEKCLAIENQLKADEAIALLRRQSELAEIDTKLLQAESHYIAKRNKLEYHAPFNGVVAFRHASPGSAHNQGPLLVLSKPDGLRFRFRLASAQVEALRTAGAITVELKETENTIEQSFPGVYHSATALAQDPGQSIVNLDCQVPADSVAALAEGKPIKARFSWRPPLFSMWPFPFSSLFFGLGILGYCSSLILGWRPRWPVVSRANAKPEEEASISYSDIHVRKEGETLDAIVDTIPERPLHPAIPQEAPVVAWEHPIGIRFREALMREKIAEQLLETVEMAVEQKKTSVISSIRQALLRVPTLPDHARQLLNKLNNTETDDELLLLKNRCLAQRITFLLHALEIEISAHAKAFS